MKVIQSLVICALILISSMGSAEINLDTEMQNPRTVLITGAFDGIGKAATESFAKQGWNVWATDQFVDPDTFRDYTNVQILKLDVTDEIDILQAVELILVENGNIDVLVNNAAFGLIGAQEAVTKEEMQHQFDVNLFGPILLTQAVLPSMRDHQQGHIINVSSTSGIRAIPGLGTYAATKFGLEAISEALASEVSHWNIKVTLLEPGTVNTNWVNHTQITLNEPTEDYNKLSHNLKNFLEKRLAEGQPATEVGNLIVKIAEDPNPHFRYQTSQHAREIASVKWRDVTGDMQIKQQKAFVEEMYS